MKLFYPLVALGCIVSFFSCARKGRPSGGPKDEAAPIMVTANPPYQSTNFRGDNIRIYFDEYITLKNLNQQLIISPPLKNQPLITPQGRPSKYINIKLLEELTPNTTYTFNFGNAVKDNNESNVLEAFKYVFATGSSIDSLSLQGSVQDALKGTLAKNVSVLLYRYDSTYTDSIIYKKKPNYLTTTTDSLHFKFSNLREGTYKLFAIDEVFNDYIYDANTDAIAFYQSTIVLPKDTLVSQPLRLFKQEQVSEFKRAKEVAKGKIEFGFIGSQNDLNVSLLSKTPKKFKSFSKFEQDKDTLNYWFTPIDQDSLLFKVSVAGVNDTVKVSLRKKKKLPLTVSLSTKGSVLHLSDTLFIQTSTPVDSIAKSAITILEKDSIVTPYQLQKNSFNKVALLFQQKPKTSYSFKAEPKAIVDIYGNSNDSIQKKFITKDIEDYGSITLDVQNKTGSSVLIELLDNKKVIASQYITASEKITFNELLPISYRVRAIIDANNNGYWDTGNVLKQLQPERIVYLNAPITLRANWTIDNTFEIE